MLLLFGDNQIDRIVNNWWRYLLGGMLVMCFALMLPRGWGIGLFSGFMLCSLGIYGLVFRNWRFDPGLWMLAILLTVTLAPCWTYFEYLNYLSLLTEKPNNVARSISRDQIRFWVDTSVALTIFFTTVKLAASVTVKNWSRTRPRKDQ